MLDLDSVEDVVDAVADLSYLGRGRRIGGDQLVGEGTGADAPGANLLDAAGNAAEDDLGRAAADVDHSDLALHRVAEGLRGADEGQPPLLLAAEDLDREARLLGHPRGDLLAVGRLADRRGRDRADRLGAELAGEADLSGDDLRYLGRLPLGDRPVAVERLADARIGPLLHHLLQLPVHWLRHEDARRVGPNIYGGAERHRLISHIPKRPGSQPSLATAARGGWRGFGGPPE